jgi:hypothetical protein
MSWHCIPSLRRTSRHQGWRIYLASLWWACVSRLRCYLTSRYGGVIRSSQDRRPCNSYLQWIVVLLAVKTGLGNVAFTAFGGQFYGTGATVVTVVLMESALSLVLFLYENNSRSIFHRCAPLRAADISLQGTKHCLHSR